MKTLVTIEFENETGNPSVEDIKLFVNQIIERGFVGPFDICNHCSMSGISLRFWRLKKMKYKICKFVFRKEKK